MLDPNANTHIIRAVFVLGGILALMPTATVLVVVICGARKFKQCPAIGLFLLALLLYLVVIGFLVYGSNAIYLSDDNTELPVCTSTSGKEIVRFYLPSSEQDDMCSEPIIKSANETAVDRLRLACEKLKNLNATYHNGSCYVLHPEKLRYFGAKFSCKDMPGYYGSLIHEINGDNLDSIEALMATAQVTEVWIGLQKVMNDTKTNEKVWKYTSLARLDQATGTLLWGQDYPQFNSFAAYKANFGLTDHINALQFSFICQYDHDSEHAISAVESWCNENQTALSAYYDGSCFVFNTTVGVYSRSACPPVPGLIENMAHFTDVLRWNIRVDLFQTFGEAISYNLGYFGLWSGLEQIKSNSNDNNLEEPDKSWFWATPQGYKFPADFTVSENFWQGSAMTDPFGLKNVAYNSFAGNGDDSGQGSPYKFCEYRQKNNVTDFQDKCLRSPNPSTFFSSCFTLNRNMADFQTAKSQCIEFENGHLARIDTIQLAEFLSYNLWAKSGLPTDMLLYTGLNKQWAYAGHNGTGYELTGDWESINNETQIFENCAVMDASGRIIMSDCETSQWFICQYPDPNGSQQPDANYKTTQELLYWHP